DASGELARVEAGDPDFPALVVGLGAYGIVIRVTLAVQPTYLVAQTVTPGLTWDEVLADPEAVTGSAYSVSLFTTWEGDVVGDVSTDSLTPQGCVPGPCCELLPQFRLAATPSHGDELQSEYFDDRADAAAALAAVRARADDIAPQLRVSELRSVAADDLWL